MLRFNEAIIFKLPCRVTYLEDSVRAKVILIRLFGNGRFRENETKRINVLSFFYRVVLNEGSELLVTEEENKVPNLVTGLKYTFGK